MGIGVWYAGLARAKHAELPPESWDLVKQQYPMPKEEPTPEGLSSAMVNAMVQANPFSSQRRVASMPIGAGPSMASPSGELASTKPVFVYKGRVTMGQQARAILEDASIKKTYFLQVGQEVAGFKVLDITESQVVLSTPQSAEPLIITLTPKEGKQED